MLDFLFTCGQVLCLIGYLYGAYLEIRYGDAFRPTERHKHKRVAPGPEADEQRLWHRDLGYYV